MKRSITKIIIIAALTAANIATAETEATRDVNAFLLLGGGARGVALADAMVAVPTDYSAGLYNPSAIAGLEKRGVMLSHDRIFGGMQSQDAITFAMPLDADHSVALYGIRTTVDMLNTKNLPPDPSGRPIYDASLISKLDNSFSALGFSYAASLLSGKFRYGATAKFIRSAWLETTAYGAGLDGGCQYEFSKKLRLGLTARNIGTTVMRYNPETYEVAVPEVVAGLSWLKKSEYIYGSILFLYQSPNLASDIVGAGSLAAEYSIGNTLHFRVGTSPEIIGRTLTWAFTKDDIIKVEESAQNYTATCGVGLNLGRAVADVAFRFHPDFPMSTRFTLGLVF
ncbi:MAG: hypothetical protein JNL74_05685 [Fibrobacteres bacterium]|nr:hypothetical protein [Fibrobacterota bacterium]